MKLVCVLLLVLTGTVTLAVPREPPVKMYFNQNNVFGWVQAGQSTGSVKYLGKSASAMDCMMACMTYKGGRCMSYTYHTHSFGGSYSTMCYGRVDDPMWAPMHQDNVESGRIEWPCESDMDCSLNGRCMPDGRCDCTLAWRGHRCDTLDLLPAQRYSGYHYKDDDRNISSWGGPVLRDDNTGHYHMYIAEMTNHCGINSWTLNSQIVHASSIDPLGYYQRDEVVWPPFAHEPDVIKGPSGEFVMMWSSFKYSDPLCNCSDGSTDPACKMPSAQFYTLMSEATHPMGPWSEPKTVLGKKAGGQDTNLSCCNTEEWNSGWLLQMGILGHEWI